MAQQTADLKAAYLIVSEQALLVDQALSKLKRRVGETGDLDFNMQVFVGESASVDDIIVACNTMPFASELRLVIVTGVEKIGKDALDSLAGYVADPSPTTVLAVAGEKLAKNTRLYKAIERLGGVVDRKLDKREVPGVVRSLFEQRGKSVTSDAAEELVAAVGYDLRRLSAEIDKAVAFVGARTEITREDVSAVTATTAPTSIWEFVEALGDRDCRRALARASALIGEGESVFGLHAMAVRTLRDLIAVRSLIDRGRSGSGDIAREMGRPDWQVRRLVRQARGFRGGELVDLLREAAQSEANMKTSRDSRLVLERWIVKVCG
jgi:DNA polymerase-3 subunit delta